ncbi:MAG: bifunctional pyr operon transcriptional regulator/uracil phosphoribosyltransferase PyrR [Candidatus Palauibacterales bacterium]|nr:bifunctional pyr operon transcriptional regulator/uracil phosphoribosyltransferase PyrR [Candidatus Palauibacterales bacterium]MDP2528370.1 bifunctional pyr operon transcriptional regulator/uracil phosphoribosyltransferase PyrR [Candidatus Palauibacterales bacterium]MDP2583774.1 bifunctional pyr operon transcriptional regulator/uracil phosphoribosyltransferase PyrR [Candidatus Palauibacterales bacterium]
MPGTTGGREKVMDRDAVEATLRELAGLIADRTEDPADLMVVGIRRRGVELADRIADHLERAGFAPVDTGSLDITLYRDDFEQVGPRPVIGPTELPGEITGRRVVLVDDVLYTGRTVRAALDELADFGRPRRIELCVLVDRGGRELPIQPDYVGRRLEVPPGRQVAVSVPDLDGDLCVCLVDTAEAG